MLLTVELQELIRWLRAVADADPSRTDGFESFEQYLSFGRHGVGDAANIDVHFSRESRPPDLDETDRLEPFVMMFTPGVAGLHRFADGLEEGLRRFLVREAPKDEAAG